ncbi:hypothetical protein KSS89_18455 [Pseudomonas sessilinigenes]|uniref:Uncharacterized protein n=2 Tax=Pseudomonas sessilinigenes TaxID=658629 RepID=A0ABX8MGE0_9PSED|nr:hypothetical protein [Pseudomonas sessilinigenes]QXH38256.1 hypothetical protein KSS89_18455 [Pseudomonas sessilinigenes]
MNSDLVSFFELIVILTLVGAQVFDVYAVMVRAKVNVDGTTQVLAVANWIQYLARIMNMVSVFSISLLLESKISTIGVPAMFGYSMCLGLVMILLVCKFSFTSPILRVLQCLGFTQVFGEPGKKPYWWRVELDFFSRLTWFSVLVSLFINLAIIMPFMLSVRYPEVRMTLAYTGQLMNFCASIIMFTYVDRVFFKALDSGNEFLCASKIIAGKVVAQILLVVGVLLFYFIMGSSQ